MSRYYDDEEREREEEEPRVVDTLTVEPAACCICGRPNCQHSCFSCASPVCYNKQDYFADSTCGGWILDSWHPGHPEDNEFYCRICQYAGLVPPEGLTAASGLNFQYTDHKTVQITVNGQLYDLSEEETKSLVAYLYHERGDMFGKPYDPDAPDPNAAEELSTPDLVPAGDREADLLIEGDLSSELDAHPF